MKIDEAQMKIESVGAMFCVRCIRKDCGNCDIHKAYQIMNDAFEELKRWREQDLIPRQPLIAFIDNSNIKHREWLIKAISDARRFPKAEPPTSSKTEQVERNGDCETCRRYIEQQRLSYDCQECIEMGMKDYEPYIPKE